RFLQIDARFDSLDRKIDGGLASLDQKMSTHFRWIVGMFLATIVSIVGALIGS
ncbi:MAG: hypothetical protein GX539_12275, partial [Candidatus Cloacimonetes bacterium]|nr:hypothetical protein [Candidatus Cloacimonadota bacterium]